MLALALMGVIASQTKMSEFLEKGAEIQKIPQEFLFTEGPVWTHQKTLLFTDIPASKIYSWDGKTVRVFMQPTNNANGLTIDNEGNLYVCHHGSRNVTRSSITPGKTVGLEIASTFDGKKLNSPNDIAIHPKGTLLAFTDPSYGIQPAQAELDHKSVYLFDLKAKTLTQFYKGKNMPNGLVFSADGNGLYVADSGAGLLEKFKFDGKKAGDPIWTVPAPGADGIRLDTKGNIWAACSDGVRIYSPEGKVLDTIKFPEQPANLCFGEDGKTLFVTARKGVYYVRTSVEGVMPGH